jgi:hypothetical protein
VRTYADRHLALQPFQKIQQLVGGEPAEMPVHEVGDCRLLDPEQGGDLSLRQLRGFENLVDMEAEFGACEQFVAISSPRSAKTLPEPSSNAGS